MAALRHQLAAGTHSTRIQAGAPIILKGQKAAHRARGLRTRERPFGVGAASRATETTQWAGSGLMAVKNAICNFYTKADPRPFLPVAVQRKMQGY